MEEWELRRRLSQRWEQLVEEMLKGPRPRTIDEIEDAALRLRDQVGEAVAQELSDAADQGARSLEETDKPPACAPVPPNKVSCACGRWAWSKGGRDRYVVTMAGVLRQKRAYFHCSHCRTGMFLSGGVVERADAAFPSLTHRVQHNVAKVCLLLPFGKAVDLLSDLAQVSVSAKQAQRVVERAGVLAGEWLDQRREAALSDTLSTTERPHTLYLEADGVHTPLTDGWRETKVGLARAVTANGRPDGPTRYVSHLGNAEEFGEHWYALAVSAGYFHAQRLAVLGDGAAWIWNLCAIHFPDSIEILDWFHATEHLWEAGRAAYPTDEGACRTWVKETEGHLYHGRFEQVLTALDQLGRQQPQAGETVRETLVYFQNNRRRMDYPSYREQGLSIGSGAAESGCKQVVTQRLKGPGMRWKEIGAQAVTQLRCFFLSGQWNPFTQFWYTKAAQA